MVEEPVQTLRLVGMKEGSGGGELLFSPRDHGLVQLPTWTLFHSVFVEVVRSRILTFDARNVGK